VRRHDDLLLKQIQAGWEAIVGPDIAALTKPRGLYSGTLDLACGGPIALEMQCLAEALIGRINGHLGRMAITRLRLVQWGNP
jgi:hypothetical protein